MDIEGDEGWCQQLVSGWRFWGRSNSLLVKDNFNKHLLFPLIRTILFIRGRAIFSNHPLFFSICPVSTTPP